MILRDLQTLLSQIYGIEQCHDVHDFLVTDAAMLENLETADTARATEEKLLIHEQEDELGVSLYLNRELLERLMAKDPRRYLGQSNFADFCKVLEGISHFIYLAWNAAADKSVTLMEMELQAEVDKYIGARVLLKQQASSPLDGALFDRLFDDPAFDDRLEPEELARYRDASTYARRYCLSLEKRFSADEASSSHFGLDMIRDLRAFYRLPQPEKVSHIQTATFA